MNGVPRGLIGMIALVVAVEHALAAYPLKFTASTSLLTWQTIGRAAGCEEALQSEILCFGDSLVNQGVYPRILEASVGRSTYNLALPAGTPATSYFMLRRALNNGARPRALILDFHALILPSRPDLNVGFLPEFVTTRELIELSWAARDPRMFTVTALAKTLTSIKDRHAIREWVLESFRGQEVSRSVFYPGLVRNWRVNRGVMVPPVTPSPAVGANVDSPLGRPSNGAEWFAYKTNEVYVRKLLDLAAAQGIRVFWVLPPISPAEHDRLERKGVNAGYTRFVAGTQALYPNIVVIDGRNAGYPRAMFNDEVHLNRLGASTFTQALATLIGPALADRETASGRRRFDLPAFQSPTLEPVPLEDVVQSYTATLAPPADRVRR